MKAKKTCSHCGAKIVEYKHSLSIGLARGLYKIASVGGGPVNLKDLGFTFNQRTNFQKLRYWGLVEKKGDVDNLKGGEWALTKMGHDFMNEKHTVFKSVWTYRGEPMRFDGKQINFSEITGGYKYRPEYALESKVHRGKK